MNSDLISSELLAITQVILIDLVLAGDNAIVVGMAAAGVPRENRRVVICCGIALAVGLRILFAALTMQLLDVIGLTLAGGLLLLWVCWKLYRELREAREETEGVSALTGENGEGGAHKSRGLAPKSIRSAVIQVAIADVSMSLDNVLAVAGAANDHMSALVIGLSLSVILMGVGATLIASVLNRHHWIGYLGLLLIAYVAFDMIWRGCVEVLHYAAI